MYPNPQSDYVYLDTNLTIDRTITPTFPLKCLAWFL